MGQLRCAVCQHRFGPTPKATQLRVSSERFVVALPVR